MKTEQTVVTETIAIWAIPHGEWYMKNNPNAFPFMYAFRRDGDTPYVDGSVKICEHEVHLVVPDGIDLLQKAVETLSDEIKKVKKQANDRVEVLTEQMNKLMLLEHIPSDTHDFVKGVDY